MPYAMSDGVRLYWNEIGQGPPVLLIMGLSFTHEMWYRVVPVLRKRRRVILFDNRGVGRSDCPKGPYSIRQMARDAAAVLDAAGVPTAAVIGASMGGMIAQELALEYPERVSSLLLACTSYGGVVAKWPRPVFPRLGTSSREQAFLPMLYSKTTPRERIEEDLRIQCACACSWLALWNQLSGILVWSSWRRLPQIHVPTMVIHGASDRLIPPENGRALASRIPGAQFRLIPDAGHILTTDQPEACRRVLLDVLKLEPDPAGARLLEMRA
ncbi:MAG TPA: alpha/beta fold hydrolase [Bryobacteraceae bacterium]|jgi:pimeloyl-ACP methyl ester carboxylesterase|nr:alpha/beta fold hydrolase [Bryobacteraceae bacterium]